MKIMMISAEFSPFAKTGGLADAVSSLSIALQKLNNEVCVVLPRYYSIDKSNLTLHKKAMCVAAWNQDVFVDIYKTIFHGVTIYFIDYEKAFGRDGIYGSSYEPDFYDNPYRFSILCRAAFALCHTINWYPDVMHSHDWSSALIPVLLKHYYRNGFFSKTVSVFSIHNMGYQGKYPLSAFPLLSLDPSLKKAAQIEQNNLINLLQAGIFNADYVTTVSPTYAKEIQTSEGGFGLDGLLRVINSKLSGILNGVDTNVWNPEKDNYLCKNFSKNDLSNKNECKKFLQQYFNLEINPDKPIFGIISRLAEQKGIHELFYPMYGCMYNMCKDFDAQFVVVGKGDKWCEDELNVLQAKLPNLKVFIGYNESLSHMVEAGSDFFIMPSRYEPCGLNQLYSQIYGTIPIVRNTGGLIDTVIPYDKDKENATGLYIYNQNPEDIYKCVKFACDLYKNKDEYKKMQINAMSKDFSWNLSAQNYIKVYNEILNKFENKQH